MEFSHLFQPLQIGHIRFRNRIFSAPVQSSFLDGNGYSPRTNTRKDLYGGSARNRFRFPLEVLARVRETVGPGVLIQLSVSAAEHIKGGDTLDNTIEFVKLAHQYVNLIHVTASVNTDSRAATIIHPTAYQPHKIITGYAAAIKAATDLPVVAAVGGCSNPASLRECVQSGYFAGRNIEFY